MSRKSSGESLSHFTKCTAMGTSPCVVSPSTAKERFKRRRRKWLLLQQDTRRDYTENTVKAKKALLRCATEKNVKKREIDKRTSLSYNVRQQIGIITTEHDGASLCQAGLPLCDHLNCIQASHTIHPNLVVVAVNRNKIRSKPAGPTRWRQINSDGRTRRALERRVWANFVHLPARVRQRLLQTFMHEAWNETADDTPEWRFRSRRQLKYGGNKWCAEFANNLRPVSTTWPWSIRPSLAVLWGVCWMFYSPQQGDGAGQQQQPQRQRHQQYGWQADYGIDESILTRENFQQLTPGTYCTPELDTRS